MSGGSVDPDGGTDVADEGSGRSIRFLEEGPVELIFRQSFSYSIQVDGPDGPVASARIDVALNGGQDSSLDATVLETDADGIAGGTLVAATVAIDRDFVLRASLPTGETAELEIRTSAPRDVRVTLAPQYDGERRVSAYAVALSPGGICPTAYLGPSEPGTTTLRVDAADPTFVVPVGLLFSSLQVSVAGIDTVAGVVGDVTLTWGCVDGIAVPTAGLAALPVSMIDVAWPRPDTHATTTRLPLGPLAAEVVHAVFASVAPALDGSASAGALAIDGMIAALDADGNAPAREVLAARRGLDDLDAVVDEAMPDLAGILRGARDDAVAFLNEASIRGELELGEVEVSGNSASVVRWIDLTDGTATVPFADDGAPAVEAMTRAVRSSSGLELRQHEMPVSLARIVELVLGAGMGGHAAVSFTDLLGTHLQTFVPCESVAAALAASSDILAVCDTACLLRACSAWRDAVVVAAGAELAQAARDYSSLAVTAQCGFLDPDGRLAEAGRCDGDATARWSGMVGGDLPPGPFTVDPSPP